LPKECKNENFEFFLKIFKMSFYRRLKSNGFTLLETMIVIFIIGVLAAIVFVVAGSARIKGRESKIMSDLYQLQNIAERIYLKEGNYGNVDSSSEISAIANDISSLGGNLTIVKNDSTTKYCAYSPLISQPNWVFCVDALGFAGKIYLSTSPCNPTSAYCSFSLCPDFNKNGFVDCRTPSDPDYPGTPTSCPNLLDDLKGSDLGCIGYCLSGVSASDCSNQGNNCPQCPDINGNGVVDWEDCRAIYDVDGNRTLNFTDAIITKRQVGKNCQ